MDGSCDRTGQEKRRTQNGYGCQDGAGLLLRRVGLRKTNGESVREDGGTTLRAMILFGQGEESGHTEKVWVSKGEVGKAMRKER